MNKVFLLIIFLKLTACDCELLSLEDNQNKISGYICDLIKDFNKKYSNIHAIAILNLENENSGYFVT